MTQQAEMHEGGIQPTPRYDASESAKPLSWAQKMSNHIAYALLAYTGLQIFVTMSAIRGDTHSILPYFALVLLIAIIIPACRNLERHWEHLTEAESNGLAGTFRTHTLLLWVSAIGLPFLIAGIATLLHSIF